MIPGQKLTALVKGLAVEGAGLAVPEGKTGPVVFVPFTVAGDRVQIEITESKKNFARGKLLEILSPGPGRINPACSLHFSESRKMGACGGCNWQHLSYSTQLVEKRNLVIDTLKKIGGFKNPHVKETIASPQVWNYRNKVQIPFGKKEGKIVCGFYEMQSHRIVEFSGCPVQSDLSVRIALKVKALAQAGNWPIYDEVSGNGWLRHLLIRSNHEGKSLLAFITRNDYFPKGPALDSLIQEFPQIVGIHQNIQPLKTSVILGRKWKKLWGQESLTERIGPFVFKVSAGSFLQVNTPAAEILYRTAIAGLADGGRPALVLDLYCGVGTTSLWASQVADRVIGVEENPQAVADAWENARLNKINPAFLAREARACAGVYGKDFRRARVRFLAGKSEAVLSRTLRDVKEDSAVLCDPPRTGLAPYLPKVLGRLPIRKLVYISCDSATFSRDASLLCHQGFSLRSVQPVDLFPQTSHVELVGIFEREPRS